MNKEIVTVYCDGIRDDTDAVRKIINGEAIGIYEDGSAATFPFNKGRILISKTIEISDGGEQENNSE